MELTRQVGQQRLNVIKIRHHRADAERHQPENARTNLAGNLRSHLTLKAPARALDAFFHHVRGFVRQLAAAIE